MRPTSRRSIKLMKRLIQLENHNLGLVEEFDVIPTKITIGTTTMYLVKDGYVVNNPSSEIHQGENPEVRGLIVALISSAEVIEHYILELIQKIYKDTYGDTLHFQDGLITPMTGSIRVRSTGCPPVDLDLYDGRIDVEGSSIIPSPYASGVNDDDLNELRGLLYIARML